MGSVAYTETSVFPCGQPDQFGPTAIHRMNDTALKKAWVRAAKLW